MADDAVKVPGPFIPYRPVLVDVAGSVTAALLLSQFLYWQRNERGPFTRTIADIERTTRLTRRQQESARAKLKEVGVLRETSVAPRRSRQGKKVFGQVVFEVDISKLRTLVGAPDGGADDDVSSNGGNRHQETASGGNRHCNNGGNRHLPSGGNRHPIKEIEKQDSLGRRVRTLDADDADWDAFLDEYEEALGKKCSARQRHRATVPWNYQPGTGRWVESDGAIRWFPYLHDREAAA